jgi:integrase
MVENGVPSRVSGLSRESAKRVLNYLKKEGSTRDALFWALGITTGLRVSTLLLLRYADVLDNNGKITGLVHLPSSTQGGDERLPLQDIAREVLRDHLRSADFAQDDYIFASRKGMHPITRQHALRLIKGWCRECGIEGTYGTRTMRKTFAMEAYETTGRNATVASRMTGHRSSGELRDYLGIADHNEREAWQAMNQAWSA